MICFVAVCNARGRERRERERESMISGRSRERDQWSGAWKGEGVEFGRCPTSKVTKHREPITRASENRTAACNDNISAYHIEVSFVSDMFPSDVDRVVLAPQGRKNRRWYARLPRDRLIHAPVADAKIDRMYVLPAGCSSIHTYLVRYMPRLVTM